MTAGKGGGGVPLFPMRRSCPLGMPAEYAEMREHEPVRRARLADGESVWLISRYDDIRAMLMDPRLSTDRSRPGFPILNPETAQLRETRVFLGMDAAEHAASRRIYLPEFRQKNVSALWPFVQRCVDEHLDRLIDAGPPGDLVRSLTYPVPALAVGHILGVPEGQEERLEELAVEAMVHRGHQAFKELFGLFSEVSESKRRAPGHDLMSRVIREQVEPGHITHWSMLTTAFVIFMAGYETMANALAIAILWLLEHPDQLAELRSAPGLIEQAIEELLRLTSVGELASVRVATEDIDVHGTTIRAGEGVIMLGGSGNRDARVFADPDTLDIRRDARKHLAFGHGAHICIGAGLARLEMVVVCERLLARMPGLRLTRPITDDAVDYAAVLFGLKRLEVTW